jgi:hypothetical protein
MNLNDLKKAAARAQQDLQLAERKAADLQNAVKTAKAIAEQVRQEHKRLRKAAKQAKKRALAAEEQASKQRRLCEKAQKRLAKALKKLAKTKGGRAKKTAKTAAAFTKPASPKPKPNKRPPILPETQKPLPAGPTSSSPAEAGIANPTTPTV